MRSPHSTTRSSSHSQLEKARAQQQKPNAAKTKQNNPKNKEKPTSWNDCILMFFVASTRGERGWVSGLAKPTTSLPRLHMVWCLLYKLVNEGEIKKGDKEPEIEKPSQQGKWDWLILMQGLQISKDSQPLLIPASFLRSADNTDYAKLLDEHLNLNAAPPWAKIVFSLLKVKDDSPWIGH